MFSYFHKSQNLFGCWSVWPPFKYIIPFSQSLPHFSWLWKCGWGNVHNHIEMEACEKRIIMNGKTLPMVSKLLSMGDRNTVKFRKVLEHLFEVKTGHSQVSAPLGWPCGGRAAVPWWCFPLGLLEEAWASHTKSPVPKNVSTQLQYATAEKKSW